MANIGPSVRITKRRKKGRHVTQMVEDDDSTIDTVMLVKNDSPTRRKVQVPVRLQADAHSESSVRKENTIHSSTSNQHLPDMHDFLQDEMQDDNHETSQRKERSFYMKEFVSRVGFILDAVEATEALPANSSCAGCATRFAIWRCQDCTTKPLCRQCVRHKHFDNPFHRIQLWTGTYFRDAALWEVGVYIILNHRSAPYICPNMEWQQKILENFQTAKDDEEQEFIRKGISAQPSQFPSANHAEFPGMAGTAFNHHQTAEQEAAQDARTMEMLDGMLCGLNPDGLLEEDDEQFQEDSEADLKDSDVGATGFTTYVDQARYENPPEVPGCDALCNQYIRVVHTNGIHHIALVSCLCQGHESIINDLFYAKMVPTSFRQIRTLFTFSVLDYFRYCNLELKASAYQFFQLLRRISLPLNPSKVVNLYHELRRLSRLWRWLKKLKWAGYGFQQNAEQQPSPGSLGNFCPACP